MPEELNESVVTTPVEPVETPSESVLRATAKKYGYTDEDLSRFDSDEQLATTLFGLTEQYAQYRSTAEPLVQVGRQFAEHADKLPQFQQWLTEQAKPAEPVEPEKPKFEWHTPEYDPTWESVTVEQDPIGYATAQQKLKAYQKWARDTQRKVLHEYPQLAQQAVEPMLSEREKALRAYVDEKLTEARQSWEQEQVKATVAQREDAWLRDHAMEFYEHDPAGQPVLRDGQMVPTAYGRQAWDAYEQTRSMTLEGKPLPFERATHIALAMIPKPSENGQPKPPKPKSESPPRFLDTVSEAELRPVERRPGGNESPPSMYQNPDAVIEAAFREAATETGVNLNA
jgi:hypothetical protein